MSEMSAQSIMIFFSDGDEHGWATELSWLWTNHRKEMLALMDSVLADGIREPVQLGYDGRVWDGHHRIGVALALDIPVPVEHVKRATA